MPKARTEPTYLLHRATGQARTIIDGKTHYLGKYNTPECEERFRDLVAEWRLRNNVDGWESAGQTTTAVSWRSWVAGTRASIAATPLARSM